MAAFQRGVALRPWDAGLYTKLGVALCDLSRFDEAEAAFRRAIALDPGLTRARFNLAIALAGQRRLIEAEQAYRDVIARDPDYRGVWLNLGNLLADQDKLDAAVEALSPRARHRTRQFRAAWRARRGILPPGPATRCDCALSPRDGA